jgi:hypothetical protein
VKVLWSVVLLLGLVLAICAAYFFGHGLSVHDKAKWFGASAACLVAAVVIIGACVKLDRHTPDATVHLH